MFWLPEINPAIFSLYLHPVTNGITVYAQYSSILPISYTANRFDNVCSLQNVLSSWWASWIIKAISRFLIHAPNGCLDRAFEPPNRFCGIFYPCFSTLTRPHPFPLLITVVTDSWLGHDHSSSFDLKTEWKIHEVLIKHHSLSLTHIFPSYWHLTFHLASFSDPIFLVPPSFNITPLPHLSAFPSEWP